MSINITQNHTRDLKKEFIFNIPAMGRDRPGCLEPNLALNTPRNGAATAYLDNLCQALSSLTVKNFLIANLILPSFRQLPGRYIIKILVAP